jgi:hypothetical protein
MTRRRWSGTDAVVGIDIDGTLGRYHEHFLGFAREWLGTGEYWPGPPSLRSERTLAMGPIPWSDDAYDGSCKLYEYMGVSKARYRQCKLAYRRGGLKRSMRPYSGARELLVALRRRAWVVVCTTRPYLSLDNIEPDTVEFLRRNRLPYDDLLMGEHKYRDLKKRYGDQVAAVVDDEPALLAQARSLSPPIPALFMSRPHNNFLEHDQFWWVTSCHEARLVLLDHLKTGQWMLGLQPKNEEYR